MFSSPPFFSLSFHTREGLEKGGGFRDICGSFTVRAVISSVCPKTCGLVPFARTSPLHQIYKSSFLIFLCDSGHQQEVAGHELHAVPRLLIWRVQTPRSSLWTSRLMWRACAVRALDVPDTHWVVHGCWRNQAAVQAEGEAGDVVGVALQLFVEGPGCQVSQLQPLVSPADTRYLPLEEKARECTGRVAVRKSLTGVSRAPLPAALPCRPSPWLSSLNWGGTGRSPRPPRARCRFAVGTLRSNDQRRAVRSWVPAGEVQAVRADVPGPAHGRRGPGTAQCWWSCPGPNT